MKKKSVTSRAAEAEALLRLEKANAERRALRMRNRAVTAIERSIPRKPTNRGAQAIFNSYPSVSRNRLNTFSPARLAPADTHLDSRTLERIQKDSQHLYRSNPLVRSIVRAASDAVCGPVGPNLVFMSKDEAWVRETTDRFWAWANNEGPSRFDSLNRQTLMETVRAAVPAWYTDGDFAIVYFDDGSVRVVEAAEIQDPPVQAGRKVVSGVEYDADGAPVALWVSYTPPGGDYTKRDMRRVPWSAVTLVRNPIHRRMNQTRGEPGLAASLRYVELIDDAIDATILAYRVAAYTALVVKSSDPSQFVNSAIAQTAALDGASNPARPGSPQDFAWEPLGVMTVGQNDAVEQVKPEHPSQGFESFFGSLMRYVGAESGVPTELSQLDATKTNYHGFKSAVGNAYRSFGWQQYVLTEWLTTLTKWRIGLWIASGELSAPDDWDRFEWRFPGPPIVDVKQEYEAAALGVAQRLRSRSQALQDIGYTGSVEDLDSMIEAEVNRMREKGIEPSALPGSGPSAQTQEQTP